MAFNKGIGFGSTLSVDVVGGSSFVEIGTIVDAIENEVSAEVVDTTVLGDLWKTFATADLDGGEVTYVIALDNDDTQWQSLANLLKTGTAAAWQIEYSNSTIKDTFDGLVTGLSRTIAKRDLLTSSVTIKVTGNAGLAGSGSGEGT